MKGIRTLVFTILSGVSLSYSQGLDISGYKVVQAETPLTPITITLPQGTIIQPGGYIVIGRNQTKAAFETFWATTLSGNVVYINGTTVVGGNGFPVINGNETYIFQSPSSVTIEGPTVAMTSGQSIKRVRADSAANLESGWTRTAWTTGNPGTGMVNTNTGKLVISEFSDALGIGEFVNEFLELFYDVTPPQQGQGSLQISPPRWKFDVSTDLQFVFKPQADTLQGFRFTKPGPVQWDSASFSIQPDTAVLAFSGDTAVITNLSLAGADSVVVTIGSVTAADTTNEFAFDVQSSTDSVSFYPISAQPKTLIYGSPRPISTVKRKEGNGVHSLLGKWAVARGIVTVGNEFGGPTYLQDSTGGMALFDSSVSNNVQVGDDIEILGLVAPFNDLFEFAPCTLLEKHSEGNPVDTLVLTILQIKAQTAAEPYEGRLVRINGITSVTTTGGGAATSWAVTGSGTNYVLHVGVDFNQTRIDNNINLANLSIPAGTFDMVGVLGQFLVDYQLLPRYSSDVIQEGAGPRIVSAPPYESNITADSMTFQFETDVPGTSIVNYGLTGAYGSQVTDTNLVSDHVVTVTGLNPATLYHVQLGSANAGGTTLTSDYVVSTSSQSSTGVINVYFNKSIDASVAVAETAKGLVSLSSKVIDRINAARYSIDVCLYSLSGSVGANIADALVNAKSRGVKVRVIGEKDNQSSAPWATLVGALIPKIDDGYDLVNAGAGLMHNKFFVFDYRGGAEDSIWVWSGSWNATDPGTNNDLQNGIEIQDKALAGAYTVEFNEMWGSNTDTQNQSASRFGARKTDNTPHLFDIAGTPVELYFSPSDRTTSQIIRTVNKAVRSINIAMLTFTRSDISAALKTKRDAGVSVRGVLDNGNDQGSQYSFFVNNGMDFLIDANSGLLHHKYAIIDAEDRLVANEVITGSHNWSSSAENSNNENTLIIGSKRIANLYLQEFKARYTESGGADGIIVGVERVGDRMPEEFALSQNYPNPFNPATTIEFQIERAGHVSLTVYDVLGRELATLVNENKQPGTYRVKWDAGGWPSGVYFYRLAEGESISVKTMLLVK